MIDTNENCIEHTHAAVNKTKINKLQGTAAIVLPGSSWKSTRAAPAVCLYCQQNFVIVCSATKLSIKDFHRDIDVWPVTSVIR